MRWETMGLEEFKYYMDLFSKANASLPPTVLCDFYKTSHRPQYPKGTQRIYSTLVPRSNKYFPLASKVVVWGIQAFIKKYLLVFFDQHFFNRPKKTVVAEYKRVIKFTLGVENPDTKHIEELHDLGYLPIKIKALKEGTLAPIKIPILTIENTDDRFFWITNYLETILSTQTWQAITSATIAHEFRKLLDKFAMETIGSTEGVEFQGHDFSMRGMSSLETAELSGAAHLLSFVGTDTIPAILFHERYYKANIETELVGTSIPATEHSVMCSYGQTDEFELFKYLMTEVYPNGFFSVVSDTWDFWKVIGEYLPRLKDEVMARDGRVVIRPDSGDPVDIVCGTLRAPIFDNFEHAKERLGKPTTTVHLGGKMYLDASTNKYMIYQFATQTAVEYNATLEEKGLIHCLWDIFGGSLSEKGFKILDSHIGAIYGDGITIKRATEICERLRAKGFASTNIVFGIGSYTYQCNTRDTFSQAIKATWAEVNGEERMLFKDPKTDDGTKRSLRGRVHVSKVNGELVVTDGLLRGTTLRSIDLLETVFEDGKLVRDQSLAEIRELLASQE
jgi:nicotinamide phosphoribosyltransferase